MPLFLKPKPKPVGRKQQIRVADICIVAAHANCAHFSRLNVTDAKWGRMETAGSIQPKHYRCNFFAYNWEVSFLQLNVLLTIVFGNFLFVFTYNWSVFWLQLNFFAYSGSASNKNLSGL